MTILHKRTPILILLILLLIFTGCQASSTTGVDSTEAPLSPSSTLQLTPSPSHTPLPATETATPVPPTHTLTATSTDTSTATQTSEPPYIVIDQDTTCRTGPGLVYDIRAYLAEGTAPTLLGHNEDNSWWTVEEPDFNATCWVSAEFVSVAGDLETVAVFTAEPTPSLVPSPTEKQKGMKIFLVALNTGGPFGCGDGLVYYYSGKPRTDSVERDLKGALNALFKLKSKFVGEHYNPVYNAHLHVLDVDVIEATGKVFVYLAGSIPKPPNECEAKRIHDQVWETARQISGYRNVTIRVGDKLLGDLIAVGDK